MKMSVKWIETIEIKNRKTYRGPGEYVGRSMPGLKGSVLGNPFRIGPDNDRKPPIKRYLRWLRKKYRERGKEYRELCRLAELAKGGGLVLCCWCRPLVCYAQIIAYILREMLRPKYVMGGRIAEYKKRKIMV